MKKIMLVDGNSLINRGFYAVPLLTNKDGEYTNGVYGFLNIFFKLMDEEKPEMCAVCFDVHQPTFRHKLFAEYKGTRKGMPEELRPQLPLLKELLKAMNISVMELGGFEADDLLGTLAVKADGEGVQAVVVSGDRDLLQIASERILIRIPKTKGGTTTVENYYAKDVEALYGVTPKEFIEVKALMGDSSDNVPGVPSIGEKTAVKIIQQYKSVENAIENYAEVKPAKASKNLSEFREQAMLSKTLVTINTEAPVEFNADEFEVKDMYNEQAYRLFRKYDFRSMLSRFRISTPAVQSKTEYTLIKNKNIGANALGELNPFEICAYKLIIEDDELAAVAVAQEKGKASVYCFDGILDLFKDFFESDCGKIAHNAKEDAVFLNKRGIKLNGVVFDTMLASYIINSGMDKYEYNDIAAGFLGESYPMEEEVLGKGKSKKSVKELADDRFASYCGAMADVSLRAYPVLDERLKEENTNSLYYDVELPLTFVLADMELAGMQIKRDALIAYRDELDKKINELTGEIYWLADEEFNINSPKQLSYILFEKLALKGGKKTKTGWSTSADVLEKLKDKNEIVSKVLEYRSYSKLKSTYADGLLAVMHQNGRVYSTFNQTITTTGRISSTEPNLQNIPVRLELGRQLRKVFVPEEGYIYLDADYSQIELRVLAELSGDEILIDSFKNNKDIHTMTASQVFGVPFDEVTPLQRRNAKAVNFGIIYGISAFGLGQDVGIGQKEAKLYIESYFNKYPKIKAFMDGCVESAKENGYALTMFNRRRYIPELSASNFMQRSFGERVAMNMPVQGTAADIIKIAMVNVHKRLTEGGFKSRLVLQVHDELLIEAYKPEEEEVKRLLREEMENAVSMRVPLVAEVHSGSNWYEVK